MLELQGDETRKIRRIIITGCREWNPISLVDRAVSHWFRRHGLDFVVVHGDCPTGIDWAFRDALTAIDPRLQEPHPAQWKLYGNAAGPIRNSEMVDLGADVCVAFHRNIMASRGTLDCARKAIKAGIMTFLVSRENLPAVLINSEDLR